MIEDHAHVEERIVSAHALAADSSSPHGTGLYVFVSEACGAPGFSTGIARFAPGASLPYHFHPFSEAVTIVEGRARFVVEGRAYRLHAGDSIHIPEGIAHMARNDRPARELIAHWAFGGARPGRELTDRFFPGEERGDGNPSEADPETIVRYDMSAIYELAKNAFFLDLFARRFGAEGICGGHGRFLPGASLPCHIHDFDESITVVSGAAVCLVQGRRYELSDYDTAFIPRGVPHRFLNESSGDMAMIWVYAGDEPDRRIVNARYCSGELSWPGASLAQVESL
ncbi:MAG: cupin domain-containing protein [Terracidiphilus sp.]